MESKENAAKLQLLIDDYVNNVKSVRNKKFDRSSVKKKVLEEELIEEKIKILENGIKKMEIDNFEDLKSNRED